MAASGRSRNAPCFCGSGGKHCCGRSLTPVRTSKSAEGRCRWRFWQAHPPHDRYASEVAEHICNGERVWIASGTAVGTTWTIDKDPATLLEILGHLPGALYDRVIKQTMTALNNRAPAAEHNAREPSANPGPDETLVLGEIHPPDARSPAPRSRQGRPRSPPPTQPQTRRASHPETTRPRSDPTRILTFTPPPPPTDHRATARPLNRYRRALRFGVRVLRP